MGRRGSLLLAVLVLPVAAVPAAPAATVDVRIQHGGFMPAAVSITAGDTVRWTNWVAPFPPRPPIRFPSNERQVVSEQNLFVSPLLAYKQEFSYTFAQPGVYTYIGAGDPNPRGTVQVAAPSVTLSATASLVAYRGETHLTGVVSTRQAGERVALLERGWEQPSPTQLAVATTGIGGAFDLVARPLIATSYAVEFRGVRSGEVAVGVRAAVTFRPGRPGFFVAGVSAGVSYAGQWVTLQRRTEAGDWTNVARYRLGPRALVSFRVPRQPGVARYRVHVAAMPGYAEGWSGTQTVRVR